MINLWDLPLDIILRILEFVPPEEVPLLIHLHPRFKDIIYTFPVSKALNLQKAHLLTPRELNKFFHQNSLAPKIVKLVLNGLWWFTHIELILKCKNLEILHMMDVPLTIKQFFKIVNSDLKISELSFMFPKFWSGSLVGELATKKRFLESLKYLQIEVNTLPIPWDFLKLTPNVKNLCIVASHLSGDPAFLVYRKFTAEHPKLSIKNISLVPSLSFHPGFFSEVDDYVTLESGSPRTTCWLLCDKWTYKWTVHYLQHQKWENLKIWLESPMQNFNSCNFPYLKECYFFGNIIYLDEVIPFYPQMPLLESFHCFSQWPLNSKQLNLRLLSASHPNLLKLGFNCSTLTHHPEGFVIGGLENLHNLTHLCVPPCVLQETIEKLVPPEPAPNSPVLFKKPRLGLLKNNADLENAAVNKVFNNCSRLKNLEIGLFNDGYPLGNIGGNCVPQSLLWESVKNIKKLLHLTHLTLEGIPVISGHFWIEIASGCSKMEFLRVKNLGQRGKCVYLKELSDALPQFKKLRHFRLEENYILPGNSLFKALCRCSKLERIVIRSVKNDVPQISDNIVTFLQERKQLVFAYFLLKGLPCNQIKEIKTQVLPRKMKYLFLIIINNDVSEPSKGIPFTHFREMVQCLPSVLTEYEMKNV